MPVDLEGVLDAASHWTLAQAREHALTLGLGWWTMTPFAVDAELQDQMADAVEHDHVALHVPAVEPPRFRGNTDQAVGQLRTWHDDGWRILVATDGPGLAERVREVLRDSDIPTRDGGLLEDGTVTVTVATLGTGFVVEESRLALLTESDLLGSSSTTGSTRDMRRMPSKRRKQVDPLELKPGDFVVHEQHGVGAFVEMIQRTVQGATREYLVIELSLIHI